MELPKTVPGNEEVAENTAQLRAGTLIKTQGSPSNVTVKLKAAELANYEKGFTEVLYENAQVTNRFKKVLMLL